MSGKNVILGRISGVFGVRGWVRVYSYTEPRDGILEYRECFLEGGGRLEPVSIAEGQRHGKGVVLRLDGIEDRDRAAALVGADLSVRRDSLPEPAEGSYYWADLEGLDVRHVDGTVLGTVDHLLETGANDVLVVTDGRKQVLIPFVTGSVIRNVDLQKRVIDVDWEWD